MLPETENIPDLDQMTEGDVKTNADADNCGYEAFDEATQALLKKRINDLFNDFVEFQFSFLPEIESK